MMTKRVCSSTLVCAAVVLFLALPAAAGADKPPKGAKEIERYPPSWRLRIKEAIDAGVTHLQTMPWVMYGDSGETLEQKQDGLRRFADEIISRL